MLVLKVVSSKNLYFAVDILEAAHKDNRQLKEELERKENNTLTKRSEQIVDSVKSFVKLRLMESKKTRKRGFTCAYRGVYIYQFR